VGGRVATTDGKQARSEDALGVQLKATAVEGVRGRPCDRVRTGRPDSDFVAAGRDALERRHINVKVFSGLVAEDLKCEVTDIDGNPLTVELCSASSSE
jgi:hypothetical protein